MTDVDFDGEWYGWRLRGRHLVSEERQRMTIERLRGLMWRDEMEFRLAGYASRRATEEARRAAHRPKLKVVVMTWLSIGIAVSRLLNPLRCFRPPDRCNKDDRHR